MREIALIAWREYRQYVLSRGFLLLIIAAPLGVLGLGALMGVAATTKSIRHFVVVEAGAEAFITNQIDTDIYRSQQRRTIRAWDRYVTSLEVAGLDMEILPDIFHPDNEDRNRIEAFAAAGGIDVAMATITPHLPRSAPSFEVPKPDYQRHPLPDTLKGLTGDDLLNRLRPYLLDEASFPGTMGEPLFAVLVLPEGVGQADSEVAARYWARNHLDTELFDFLTASLTRAQQQQVAQKAGLSDEEYKTLVSVQPLIEKFRPDRVIEEAALNRKDQIETTLPAAMAYVLFILIFSVGSLLLTNTIEERSNKIVETLLSSVTANQLMMGKLIGIGAVGLTLPAIGLVATIISAFTIFADNVILREVASILVFSPLVWIYLFYFLCAYVIFSMIYLAIGAISNSLQDAQTFLGPVTLVVMAPLPLMVWVFREPNGLIATIMTWIPIYTPFAVMLRAAADPPLWEIVGATIFMMIFGIFFVSIMGRIFRRGLLNDSPPNLKSLLKLAGRD